jgi:hypothetical protein
MSHTKYGRDEIKLIDLNDPRFIQIRISHDGKTVWINDEDGCVVRINRIGALQVSHADKPPYWFNKENLKEREEKKDE